MARKGQQLKMRALVDTFLEEKEGIEFEANVTRTKILQKFAAQWDEQSPFRPAQSLTKRDVELWFSKYRKADGKPVEQTTRRCYAAHIRGFIQWGIGAHEFDVECATFKPGKTSSKPQRPKTWFPDTFFKELWEAETPYFRGLMAFTCLTLARGNEIVGLHVRDLISVDRVNLDRPKVGMYDDKLPIVADLQPEIARYLTWYRHKAGVAELDPDWWLFPKFGNGYGHKDGWVNPVVQRDKLWGPARRLILKHSGLTGERAIGIGAHSCRRSMAAALHKRLVDAGNVEAIRVVQGMLGHSDVRHTQLYIGMNSITETRNNAMDGLSWFNAPATNAEVLPFPGAVPWDEEDNPFETTQERLALVR